MHEGDGFLAKLMEKPYFFVKMTSPAMVQPVQNFEKCPECGVKLAQGFSLMRKWTFAVVII